jgi:hypothetical protein
MSIAKTLTMAAFAAAAFLSFSAQAAPVAVTCGDAQRFVTLTTDPGTATCLYFAAGDALGGGNNNNNSNDGFLQAFPEYILLDKSDENKGIEDGALTGAGINGGTSGDFSIGTLTGQYSHLAIGFKSGGGQNALSAFVFKLPSGVTSGDWDFSFQQALSHANLYGIEGTATPIPLPAAGWMLISGLAGLGFLGRRKARA